MKGYTEEKMRSVHELASMSDWIFFEQYLEDVPVEE